MQNEHLSDNTRKLFHSTHNTNFWNNQYKL